ncbi:uncharacterized protein LOC112461110 [Temnothorax curvispinosus]|uniref:Uncharacterized protein LOC112461110 n=1 Tax=Temnothorax curvispinosus TaxID=300111 RepID=A0A6J1QHV1_9HYME|nr:uncharacterized protein LOC112461110 [Temnothorax curvispinosus]
MENVPLMNPSSSLKRTVPIPDFFYTKKKKTHESVACAIEKHSSNITALTEMVTQRLQGPTFRTQNKPEDSLFLSVKAVLARVPEEKQLQCIIEILQIIQKYTIEKQNSETITTECSLILPRSNFFTSFRNEVIAKCIPELSRCSSWIIGTDSSNPMQPCFTFFSPPSSRNCIPLFIFLVT